MMNRKPFIDTNVFMSRNLVPPELFDSLHDALKLNGANVFLCCDPARNSPNDFHLIASDLHEKFEVLRAKGCNLIGPQCVLSCVKEKRALPKLGYVCCLAMDGVKVLASGFTTGERERIEKLVVAMSGSFESKISSDVTFVIVKNVQAGKYKWAASKNKHVTINWLNQCWIEHRVVPVESYRVPPFMGLVISVTRFPAEERKEMEKLIIQNGGKYSAELNKSCTHLICEIQVSEGDKFKVAQKWGTIHIVTRKWFDQSLAKRVCLNEEAYPVQSASVSSVSAHRSKHMVKSSQDRNLKNSQSALSSAATDSSFHGIPSVGNMDSHLDVSHSQTVSNIYSAHISISTNEEDAGAPDLPQNDKDLEGCIAEDSETDDLYLSDCKICIVGFNTSDTRKLLGMVRSGGGSRYMFCNDRLTHIIVGSPSDLEKRELRGLDALGVIRIVKRNWLEDCDREKKEVPVVQKHVAHDILLPKDALPLSYKSSVSAMSTSTQVEFASNISNPPTELKHGILNSGTRMSVEEVREDLKDNIRNSSLSVEETKCSSQSSRLYAAKGKHASQPKVEFCDNSQPGKFSKVFARKSFCFSHVFPNNQRDEVIQWINEGGGEVLNSPPTMDPDFIVECHGVIPSPSSCSQSICVSSHWIMSCLKEGCLVDVSSHILYSPLPCKIPLPGFQSMRFCVSQYSEKERLLLRNLCFVLGAKFGDKLTKKVTHLLCKFANGPKYDASHRWGVHPVRCEWLYECVKKNEVVALDKFHPEETPQNTESGICTVTQNPTQAARLTSMNNPSQTSGESQDVRKANSESSRKRPRLLEISSELNQTKENSSDDKIHKSAKISSELNQTKENSSDDKIHKSAKISCELNQTKENSSDDKIHKSAKGDGHPDVAAAIEDLLVQTSKIQDLKSAVSTSCEKTIFSPDGAVISRDLTSSHSTLGTSAHWLQSLEKGKEKEELQNGSKGPKMGIHDVFSETQTESQMVGYEEDLSGRQMIIDRVRSSLT